MLLGIDIGTQSLKAAVTDLAFNVQGQGRRYYHATFPQAGWAEQAPRLWENAVGPAIADALRQADVAATSVEAMGICGQLDGCMAVSSGGEPQGDCIVWMDRRAEAEMQAIPADLIHTKTGLVVDPSHMAAKISWLKRHSSKTNAAARYHQPVSYMVERLTGEAVIDHALASTTMLYNLNEGRFDPDLLALFDIAADELPRIAEAGDCAGTLNRHGSEITGLAMGTLVAVGTGDDFSTPLGAGVTRPGEVTVSIGTGEVVGGLTADVIVDCGRLVETHAYPAGGYFVENPGWLSGGAVTWLKGLLGICTFEEFDALAATSPPGAEGILFLPALTGATAPEWIAGARACFYGLTAAHGARHLARALLEGASFAMRDVIERLVKLGISPMRLMLLSGGSRSRLSAQIRADVSGRSVALHKYADTSTIGAAMLAGVASGTFKTVAEAASRAPTPAETLDPIPSASAVLDDSYWRYRELFQSLKPVFNAKG